MPASITNPSDIKNHGIRIEVSQSLHCCLGSRGARVHRVASAERRARGDRGGDGGAGSDAGRGKGLVDLAAETGSGGTVGETVTRVGLRAHVGLTAQVLGPANAALGNAVRLAGDGTGLGDVRRGRGRAEAEDGRFPLVALGGELLVLRGLGRDASGQGDVGEDRVVLGDGHVDLLVLGGLLELLRLALPLGHLALRSLSIAVVDIGRLFRIVLHLALGLVGLELDLVEEAVGLVNVVLDGLFDGLLQGGTDDLEHERLGERKEELVLRLLQLNVEVLDVHVNLVDLEKVLLVLVVGRRHFNLEAETAAAKEDVGDTRVRDGGETLLLLDVKGHIAQVHLDARDGQHDRVVVLVGNLLAAPAEVVVCTC